LKFNPLIVWENLVDSVPFNQLIGDICTAVCYCCWRLLCLLP